MKMNRLVPMLPVKSMFASVEFYQKLGFKVEQKNDAWGWAMLAFDECCLMVDQSINTHQEGPRQSVLYLYPEDIVVSQAGAKEWAGRTRPGRYLLRHDRVSNR